MRRDIHHVGQFCRLVVLCACVSMMIAQEVSGKRALPQCSKGAMMCGRKGSLNGHEDSSIFLFGGLTRDYASLQDTWLLEDSIRNVSYLQSKSYNKSKDRWFKLKFNQTDTASTPPARWMGSLTCLQAEPNERFLKNEIPIALMFGGSSPSTYDATREDFFNDVWLLYSVRMNATSTTDISRQYKWRMIQNERKVRWPRPRRDHTGVAYGSDKVVIFGGQDFNGNELQDTWVFDLKSNSFQELKSAPFPGKPRKGHVAVMYQSSMYVFGGKHRETYYADMFRLDMSTEIWSAVDYASANPDGEVISPLPRDHAVAQVVGDSMYIFSGRGFHEFLENFDEMWKFNFPSSTWYQVPPKENEMWPLGRIGGVSAVLYTDRDSFLVVFGGEDATGFDRNDLWLFDHESFRWHQFHSTLCQHPIPVSIKMFSAGVLISFSALFYYALKLRMKRTAYDTIL